MSSKKGKKGKRLILVRNDLLQEIIKITAREGKTVFAFTNDVFEQALKAYQMQTNPAEILQFYILMKLEKDRGVCIIPIDLLNYMMQKLYKTEKEDLLQKWYDSGLWYGKYLSVKFETENWLQIFERQMKKSAWNITDFSIAKREKSIHMRCICPYFTKESTEAFMKFLEGIMHSSNYKTLKNECLKGMILLQFKK